MPVTRPRTHIRVVRESDGREFPNMFVAYRELLGTASELGYSEHQRMRAVIRSGLPARDQHGFTWRSVGGAVAESTIAWTDFTFGVEIELLAPMDMSSVQERLPSGWKVVRDGSLQARYPMIAMEVVSPILQGEAGLTVLREVMDGLRARGCKINSTCGLHVHVGVRGMKPERVRRIAIAYLNAEHHFDALVPESRRSGNRYCNSNNARISGYDHERLTNASTISQIASVMNGGSSSDRYNPYRYYKLNFQSFVHHGTIEFRQHGGTIESAKACAWVRLITGFCARAAGSEQERIGDTQSFDAFIASSTDAEGQRFLRERRNRLAGAARAAA